MPKYIEKIEKHTVPVIALRGTVAFPSVSLSFEIEDELCIKAAEAAFENDLPVLVCTLKDPDKRDINPDAFFKVTPRSLTYL